MKFQFKKYAVTIVVGIIVLMCVFAVYRLVTNYNFENSQAEEHFVQMREGYIKQHVERTIEMIDK